MSKNGLGWMVPFFGEEDPTVIIFETTARVSTYLYAVCAGPYVVFEDSDPFYPPQRVLVRKTLVPNLRYELVMGITKTTIDRYQEMNG